MKTDKEHSVGTVFTYGGMDWVVLDCNKDEVFVLAKESIGCMPFDKNGGNNFVVSTLFVYLNSVFIKELEASGADTSVIEQSQINTIVSARVSLLSVEEYVKYEDVIPIINNWWWLRSPGDYRDFAASVNPDRVVYLNVDYVDNDDGAVRPVMRLKRSALQGRI